jgi:hypothetical protein
MCAHNDIVVHKWFYEIPFVIYYTYIMIIRWNTQLVVRISYKHWNDIIILLYYRPTLNRYIKYYNLYI